MKTVAQWLRNRTTRKVHSIEAEASMLEALRKMDEENVGALLVIEADQLVGMVTERDYARRGVLQGRLSVATPVREFMTRPIVTVTPQHTLRACMALMTDLQLRHLPVLDDGELVGLLSIGDLIKDILAEQDGLILHLEQYIRGEVA